MANHTETKMRPAWGATSSCTRCGCLIAWKGKWVDQGRQSDSLGADVCIAGGKWSHHRSSHAGTPPGYTVAKAGLRPDDGDLTAMKAASPIIVDIAATLYYMRIQKTQWR